MITALRLVDFKNFADETLRIGPFTVVVGANASGKSNIRDAFRFLRGIGRGYTLAEIIGGKYGADGRVEWRPIRGAANEIIRFGQPAFAFEIGLTLGNEEATYSIEISPERFRTTGFRITYECLRIGQKDVYKKPRTPYEDVYIDLDNGRRINIKWDRPALTQLCESRQVGIRYKDLTRPVINALGTMRFLEPALDRMREPTFPGAKMLGDSGENLPTVLEEICSDAERGEILASWVRELTPMDVRGFEFPPDPSGRVHLMLCEASGKSVSASSASDGTLRFLVILAALLGEDSKGMYLFEELDNGIHPVRLHLLVDLIERQAEKGGIQVLTTTHAPTLLAAINDVTFENTSVVCRLEHNSDAIIRRVADLPNVRELRKDQGLGRLHESGWMEDALFFTEDYDEAEDNSRESSSFPKIREKTSSF